VHSALNPAAADVCPAELVRRLMDAMAASAALLAQPELPELTDEALTTTYAYVEELPLLVPLAQPVAVSERLPGAEDCDEQGRCWWGFEETDDYEPCWTPSPSRQRQSPRSLAISQFSGTGKPTNRTAWDSLELYEQLAFAVQAHCRHRRRSRPPHSLGICYNVCINR
jgi:hypothetical protein